MKSIMISTGLILLLTPAAAAQVATGGDYRLDQSLVASGGGMNSAGSTYTLDGAVGEAIAGTRSSSASYAVTSGFLSASLLAPTAAGVNISGRVVGLGGEGLRNTIITLSGGSLIAPRRTHAGAFGYFMFEAVEAGRVYTITVSHKRYGFAQPVQVISAADNVSDLVFEATWTN